MTTSYTWRKGDIEDFIESGVTTFVINGYTYTIESALHQTGTVFGGCELGTGGCTRLVLKDSDDKFEWEQSIIRQILDWILDKRLSLVDAFKIIDVNFDGVSSSARAAEINQSTGDLTIAFLGSRIAES
jgi:hypothetical protein